MWNFIKIIIIVPVAIFNSIFGIHNSELAPTSPISVAIEVSASPTPTITPLTTLKPTSSLKQASPTPTPTLYPVVSHTPNTSPTPTPSTTPTPEDCPWWDLRCKNAPIPTPTALQSLLVTLSPDNPVATTITANGENREVLKVRFTGTSTINTLIIKKISTGRHNNFSEVYIYDGTKRLTSSRVFSSSTGEASFSGLNISIDGTKDLSIVVTVADIVEDVSYFQLSRVVSNDTLVADLPISGNNFSTPHQGTVTISRLGQLNNPTVGQRSALISEFKFTTSVEGGTVTRIDMDNAGTEKTSDLTNFKLMNGTQEWPGIWTSDGHLVFNFSPGIFIEKDGDKEFKIYADIGIDSKKGETIDLYFEGHSRLNVVDQYDRSMEIVFTAFDSLDNGATRNQAYDLIIK